MFSHFILFFYFDLANWKGYTFFNFLIKIKIIQELESIDIDVLLK